MARPAKDGLSYYPQDTDVHTDRKIRRLLSDFGAKGYLVYDYIKTMCYKNKGYYIQYDQDFCYDIADGIRVDGITKEVIKEVLQGCFRLCLFNEKVFKASNVITSNGIQSRYLAAKRGSSILPQFLVIPEETSINTVLTPVNTVITGVNTVLSTQSKVKEIKEEKSKENKKENNNSPLISVDDLQKINSEGKEHFEEKEKKVAAKKEKTFEEKNVWELSVENWFELYKSKLGITPTFAGREGAELKKIISKIEMRNKNGGFEPTKEIFLETFIQFLNLAWNKSQWLQQNFLLTNLNSQFDAIITSVQTKPTATKGHQHIDTKAVFGFFDEQLGGNGR